MLCYTKMLGQSHASVSLFLLHFCSGMLLPFLFSALELTLSIQNKTKQSKTHTHTHTHTHTFLFPSPPQTYLFLIEGKLLHNIALTSV